MTPRWEATVFYRTEAGLVDVIHDLEELEDIHDLVEAGPHFDAVDRIEIKRCSLVGFEDLTIEAASNL